MKHLRRDPLPRLLATDDPALLYMVRRDLLGEPPAPDGAVRESAEVVRAVARQRPDGRWRYAGGNPAIRSPADYDQLETYRQLAVLVCKLDLVRRHPAVAAAAAFLASFQTGAGDYRGIYGGQYTPNYSAAITELLIRAGYAGSAQVETAMRWLLSIRQDDGAWAIPARTLGLPLQGDAHRVRDPRTRPQPPLIAPDHRDRPAGAGRASPLPASGGHPPCW